MASLASRLFAQLRSDLNGDGKVSAKERAERKGAMKPGFVSTVRKSAMGTLGKTQALDATGGGNEIVSQVRTPGTTPKAKGEALRRSIDAAESHKYGSKRAGAFKKGK